MTETYDATREPLRAIRDLIALCEGYRDIDPAGEDNAVLDQAQTGFAALRAIFGDCRPNEAVAFGPLLEPAPIDPEAIACALWVSRGGKARMWKHLQSRPNAGEETVRAIAQCWRDARAAVTAASSLRQLAHPQS